MDYFRKDIWNIALDRVPNKSRSWLIKQVRILLVAFRGFNEDKCLLRASALTFYSMLSIVPVLAMLFGISKGFGLEEKLTEKILSIEGYNQEVLLKVSEFAQSMLHNTKGGLVAGIGVVILFWSVMKVLGNIESSFNDIWEIKQQRTLIRKFSDYFSIILITPVLFIISSSITGFIVDQVKEITQSFEFMGFFSPIIFFLLRLLPYVLIWFLLAFLYMVMPNTKVTFKSAIAAGIIAGTIFQLAEVVYFNFQFGVSKYNAIYGSFAALPLFLVWLQTSWMIVLFGAEISFANQNVAKYEFESESQFISERFRKELALLVMTDLVKRFKDGGGPASAAELSRKYAIPIRLVRQLIFDLINSELIVELRRDEGDEELYQPARDIHGITVEDVVRSLAQHGSSDIPVEEGPWLKSIRQSLDAFQESNRKSDSNRLLLEL
jgi:membrane protein